MTAESDPPHPDETVFQPQEQRPAGIQIGMLLNGIFEVRRFIASGGMGEVYEGVNVNTDERVAIKFILSHLAKDPEAQRLFRREAQILVKLSHPALVQYRVLVREAQLDVFYIVTDFIDGPSLSQVYPNLKPSLSEFKGLLRRLAEGLQAAHDIRPIPAIHRDVSPDNVLLPDGKLDQAKIIDFGIARNLELGEASVYKDTFKGKIGFAAPEQFGAYNGEIGPWTDVYSLGLVALAVATGRKIDMGSNFYEAVERRRQVPDLSAAPVSLRKLLARMLEPDPAKRIRSMADVILMLDGIGVAPPRSLRPGSPGDPRLGDQKLIKPKEGVRPQVVIGALVVAAIAMIAVAVVPPLLLHNQQAQADARSTPEALRAAVTTPVEGIDCSWLNVDVPPRPGSDTAMTVKLSGLAGDAASVVKTTQSAITRAGLKANVDWSGIYPVRKGACGPLNVFRQFREPPYAAGPSLTADNNVYYLQNKPPEPCDPREGRQAQAVTQIRYNTLDDFTLLGMEPSGNLGQIVSDRADFNHQEQLHPGLFDQCNDKLCVRLCVDEKSAGPFFQVLVSGKPPFDLAPLIAGNSDAIPVDSDWPKRFAAAAKERNWTTQIVWFKVQ